MPAGLCEEKAKEVYTTTQPASWGDEPRKDDAVIRRTAKLLAFNGLTAMLTGKKSVRGEKESMDGSYSSEDCCSGRI